MVTHERSRTVTWELPRVSVPRNIQSWGFYTARDGSPTFILPQQNSVISDRTRYAMIYGMEALCAMKYCDRCPMDCTWVTGCLRNAPIPKNVYAYEGNFYYEGPVKENHHKGMGTAFYLRWRSRINEFPQKSM